MNLHQKAVELVAEYQRVESALIDVLRKIDERKLYREHGATSLFVYATKVLGLSESVSWNFITVMRATKRSPALKQAIDNGELSVSKARRITSVLTLQNQSEWVEKAKTMSQKSLEKEVARANPQAAVTERASYVSETLMKLELGLTESELDEIKRVQDLLCQSKQSAISLKDALIHAVREYTERHDPLNKATRARAHKQNYSIQAKPDSSQVSHANTFASTTRPTPDSSQVSGAHASASTTQPTSRVLPAAIVHHLNLRDKAQCTGLNPDNSRCENRRWLDFHHVIPKAQGGADTLENLVTLCRSHHHLQHARVGQLARV